MTVDAHGREHRPAGSPASTGGQFATQSAPAASAVLELERPEVDEDEHGGYVPKHRIHRGNLAAFQSKVAAANRRLEKNGIEDRFEMTVTDAPTKIEGRFYDLVEIEMSTPKIGIDGWHFTGVHKATPAGQWISTFGGSTGMRDIPSGDGKCDHCGRKLARSKLFTIYNEHTGEKAQIGSTCVETFLGVKPEGLWALEFDPQGADFAEGGDDDEARVRGHKPFFDGESLLLHAMRASDGGQAYVSKLNGTTENPSTAERVRKLGLVVQAPIDDADRAEIAEVLAWVRAIPEGTDNDFLRNVRASLVAGPDGEVLVRDEHLAIVTAAVAGFHRAKTHEAKQKARAEAEQQRKAGVVQEHVAQVGEKITDHGPVTVVGHHMFESDYGYPRKMQHMLLLQDEQGRMLKWVASNPPEEAKVGAKLHLDRATVKSHDEYKGDLQTVVTRAKLAPIPE